MSRVPDKVYVYKDKSGDWRWRRVSSNLSDIVSESGEGYENKEWALRMAKALNNDCQVYEEDKGEA